jgi:hypothetical protein
MGVDHISRDFLDFLDAAISETPTDLLVLIGLDKVDFQLLDALRVSKDRHATVQEALEQANSFGIHSLYRYASRLLSEHCEQLDEAGHLAFIRAALALHRIGLFHENHVSPVAIDFFPSLALREDEISARRLALKWRPETGEDPVVPGLP